MIAGMYEDNMKSELKIYHGKVCSKFGYDPDVVVVIAESEEQALEYISLVHKDVLTDNMYLEEEEIIGGFVYRNY